MKDQKIIKLFEKSLTKKVISITDSSNGVDQEVKIIETKNNKYVIKIPNEKVILHREIFACNILNGIIPVPNIIFKSDYFLIQDYITGESLDKTNLSKNNFRKVYFQVGTCFKMIHQIKSKGFGPIDYKGNAKYKTTREGVDKILQDCLRYLSGKNILSDKEIKKIKLYFKLNYHFVNNNDSVLLHFDYGDKHIKIKNEKITGILDFGDLSSGPNSYDLAMSYIDYYDTEKFNFIMKGYGKFDLKEIKFYACLILIEKIKKHYLYVKTIDDIKNNRLSDESINELNKKYLTDYKLQKNKKQITISRLNGEIKIINLKKINTKIEKKISSLKKKMQLLKTIINY
tara:strand:- start:1026 stop:2054 length:1029 start_codon:yes stop_codon:yes gene_type:complete